MATKKTSELLQDCETQERSLYTSLGRLLYENVQSGGISYRFEPENAALEAQAKRLVRDIVAQKVADRKDERVPAKPVKVIAKAPVRPVVRKAPPVKAPVKAAVKEPKNKVVAVLKGVTNVLLSEFKERPELPAVQEKAPAQAISRRGQLEPYTQMIVELHVATNKVLDIQKDLNDCLSAGLLHTTGDRTATLQAEADKKIQNVVLLLGKKREEIKNIMEQKRQFFAENPDVAQWKAEEGFLKKIEQEVQSTTRRIDDLVNEVVDLFKSINNVFEKDLEQTRVERGARAVAAAQAGTEVLVQEVSQAVDEYLEEQAAEEPVAEEVVAEVAEEVAPAEPEILEETLVDDASAEAPAEETNDYGLFETAARKLGRESSSDDEKISILHTLFRNAPKRAVPFLYDMIREGDIYFQRKLFTLLGLLDYPTLVDLYRRFVTDENSSLRLQGIMGLIKLGSHEAKNVIVTAIRDHDANIRRFIVNHLDHTGGEAEAVGIAHLSGDSNDGVARVAIRKLGIMGSHFAFVTLVPKLESPNPKVCMEAIDALRKIVGTDLGYDPTVSLSERKRQAQQWKVLAQKSYTNPRLLRELRAEHSQGGKPKVAVAPKAVVRPKRKAS